MRRLLLAALLTLAPAAAVSQSSICLSAMPDYLRITIEQDNWKILQPPGPHRERPPWNTPFGE